MSVGRQIERHLRYPVALLCAYETFAIMTNKVPTISHICWKQKILIPVILGGLAVHLLIPHDIEGTSLLVDFDARRLVDELHKGTAPPKPKRAPRAKKPVVG